MVLIGHTLNGVAYLTHCTLRMRLTAGAQPTRMWVVARPVRCWGAGRSGFPGSLGPWGVRTEASPKVAGGEKRVACGMWHVAKWSRPPRVDPYSHARGVTSPEEPSIYVN